MLSREGISAFLWRRRWLLLSGLITSVLAALVVARSSPPLYEATATLQVHSAAPASQGDGSLLASGIGEAVQPASLATHLWLLQSEPLQHLAEARVGESTLRSLRARYTVRVESVEKTSLINLTIGATDKKTAVDLANAFCSAYLAQSQALQRERAHRVATRLAGQLTLLRQQLEKSAPSSHPDHLVPPSPGSRGQNSPSPAGNDSPAELQKTASALGEGSAVEPSADEKQLPVPSALASPLLMRAQQQLEELRVQEVTAGPEASVIIAPENATRELKRRWLASSLLILVAGLWLTLCLGAVFDQWDCRPHFLEDVVRDIDLPLLAWLPKTRALKELQLPWPEELLAFGHRVRLLLAARGAMKEQMPVSAASLKEPQCLLVTSSKAGEGRSLVALSLAVASALEGQGVVLVVGDDSARLRLQQLSSSPGKASVQDFSDAGWCRVTAGKAVLADVLYSTSIEGLRILMVGKPSQPGTSQVVRGTDGVCGVAWDSVVSHLRALPENDLVIIDGPPVLSSVDALRLATLTEGTLFVLSVEDVERHQVLQAVNQLRAISAPMLGLIVNKMNPGVCRGKW